MMFPGAQYNALGENQQNMMAARERRQAAMSGLIDPFARSQAMHEDAMANYNRPWDALFKGDMKVGASPLPTSVLSPFSQWENVGPERAEAMRLDPNVRTMIGRSDSPALRGLRSVR